MRTEVRCYCRTSLDGYEREEWPQFMAGIPRVGDRVESVSGKNLCVVEVTHLAGDIAPAIRVELHR